MAENSTAQALGEMNENLKVLLENYNNAFIKLKEASEAERVELQKEATKAKQALEDLLSSGSVANASKIGGKTLDEIESSIKVALKNYEETFKQLEDANANDRAKFKEELAKATQNLEDLLANATTNVVLVPTIQGATKVTNTNDAVFSFESESLLSGATIKAFEIKVNDELYTVTATSNKATFTHKFAGAIGDKITLEVTAVDNLSNKSVAGIYEVEIVDNQAPTKPTVTVTDEMTKGATATLKINGSTDADGDSITYSIIDTGTFTFSKTTGITENESIDITAPNVDKDTNASFSVVAVDSKGMQSDLLSVYILVKDASVLYNTVDIFADGSCTFYASFKNKCEDFVTGNNLNGGNYSLYKGFVEVNPSNGAGSTFPLPNILNSSVFSVSCLIDIRDFFHSEGMALTDNDNNGFNIGYKYRSGISVARGNTSPDVPTPSGFLHYYLERNNTSFTGVVSDTLGNELSRVNINYSDYSTDSILTLCDSTNGIKPDSCLKTHSLFKNLRIFDRCLTSKEYKLLAQEA